MGLGRFARRIRGLQDVFPSSDRSVAYPDSIDGTVSPIFEFPSKAASLDRAVRAQQVSNSALTPVLALGILGQGVFEEWIYASIFHNDGIGRTMIINLLDPAGAAVQVGRVFVPALSTVNLCNTTGLLNGNPGEYSDHPKKIWVPGGYQIQITGSTAAAAYQFTLQRLLVVHPEAESAVWP